MFDFLAYGFMQKGLLGAMIVGGCCSLIGVFVVLRGMSYIGAGIGHGCLAGVALAFLMGWNPMVTASVAALVMVVLIEGVKRKAALKMDTAIGVLFSLAMALAVLFIGMLKRYTPDIMGYLFGNLLGITSADLWIMGGIAIAVAFLILVFFKEIQYSTFDPEMAELSGIPAGWITLGLTILMGLTVVISLQAVGELLVMALIVLPASTAYQLTKSLQKMIALSMTIGVSVSIIGLILAYYLDVPSGSTIVILLGICFGLAVLAKSTK